MLAGHERITWTDCISHRGVHHQVDIASASFSPLHLPACEELLLLYLFSYTSHH